MRFFLRLPTTVGYSRSPSLVKKMGLIPGFFALQGTQMVPTGTPLPRGTTSDPPFAEPACPGDGNRPDVRLLRPLNFLRSRSVLQTRGSCVGSLPAPTEKPPSGGSYAGLAELEYAPACQAGDRKIVRVRIPCPVLPTITREARHPERVGIRALEPRLLICTSNRGHLIRLTEIALNSC